MPRFPRSTRVLALCAALIVSASWPSNAAAQTSTGWLPGPGARGPSPFAGVVDAPLMDARVGARGTLQLAGWVVDPAAEGWAGADTVEVFLGSMGNGGTLLTHALFAQPRPDVARAFGRADFAASGWSAAVSTDLLVPGANVLSVYAHSPARGWWSRQVTVHLEPGATTRAAPRDLGFDISFPQCGGPEPEQAAFVVLGVTGGRVFSGNPCLARQYAWAQNATSPVQPRIGLYMNTGNPGPELSTRWPAAGTTQPRACDGTWSTGCAFVYGWRSAEDAFERARLVAGGHAALVPWWLDVEVANSWSTDTATNSAALQGALAYLRSVNVASVGIYTLAADWEEIVGATAASSELNAPFADLPTWRPGPQSITDARGWCGRTVTGGRIVFVQFPSGGYDGNLPCSPGV